MAIYEPTRQDKINLKYAHIRQSSDKLANNLIDLLEYLEKYDELSVAEIRELNEIWGRITNTQIYIAAKIDELRKLVEPENLIEISHSFNRWRKDFERIIDEFVNKDWDN